MINLIKADVYRVFSSKGIYITLGFLLTLCILQSFGWMESIGISSSSMEGIDAEITQLTGRMVPLIMMRSNDNLLYILLPLIVFIASVDFSSGTAKNVLANGISRTQYYFSKLILSMLFCIAMLVSSIVMSTIIVSIVKGFGSSIERELMIQILSVFSLQLFLLLAVTSVGIFFVFTTRSTSKVIGLYIAFCLVPMLVIVLLFGISEDFTKLLDYEMVMNIRMSANVNSMATYEIVRIVIVGSVYLVLSLAGGLLIFRKCDIE